MVGLWCLLVHYDYPLLDAFLPERVDFHKIGTYMMYISVFFSILSAGEYFLAFFRTAAQNEADDAKALAEERKQLENVAAVSPTASASK
jgi:CDP-diacylglycerol---glycerol-3-phosphate 3-phosphatidyltransferase